MPDKQVITGNIKETITKRTELNHKDAKNAKGIRELENIWTVKIRSKQQNRAKMVRKSKYSPNGKQTVIGDDLSVLCSI